MKKLAKRLAAVLMAAVMTVGISMTAFAAQGDEQKTGTLTVTGSGLWSPAQGEGQQGKGKTVTAIRMFTARVTKGTEENTFDSYVLESAWKGFFTDDSTRFGAILAAGNLASENITAQNITNEQLSDCAVAYIKTLQKPDNDQMPTFAHKAQVWARAHSTETASLTTTEAAVSANDKNDATKGTATFNDLTSGYYLVYPEGGSTGDDNRGTDAMLVNVPDTNGTTEATIKSTYPTVDKEVKTTTDGTFAQNGTAQVGDQVTFQLHSKVPDMTDYTTYTFTFNDTLSDGLAFDADSVTVTVGGKAVTKGSDYTVEKPTGENGNKLTVKFDNLKTVDGATTDADIVVTYTAHITKDATTANPADNTVTVSYSDDPSSDSQGTSQPSESKVYTYQIDIDKYTGTYSNNAERLAGATFQLKTEKSANAESIQLVKDEENVYHIVANDEKDNTDVTKVTDVTTDTTGKITIKGLKAGTYYLYEKEAPAGYNKLTAPVTIVITADTADLTNFTYTLNGKASAVKDATVPVQNNKGQMLPTTGSMGTIGLVALGVAVVLIGVFMPRKKKANR